MDSKTLFALTICLLVASNLVTLYLSSTPTIEDDKPFRNITLLSTTLTIM